MNVAASNLRRRPGFLARLRDRIRSRGWRRARMEAGAVMRHCQGRLCQDVVTGRYGTLELAFANRGTILGGARVHVRLVTNTGRTIYVPWREIRLADEVEQTLWSLAAEGWTA